MQLELVERAQQGDHAAFGELVDTSYPRLFRAATLILRDSDRAKDAVQDALVESWRHVRALRDPGAWDAWLYRTTVRACYKAARRDQRRKLAETRSATQRPASVAVDDVLEVAERDRLAKELDALDVERRSVLVLHYYLDLPLPQVATILDIPVGTVNSRLHRALEAVRTSMGVGRDGSDVIESEGSI